MTRTPATTAAALAALAVVMAAAAPETAAAQQVPDTLFEPPIGEATFAPGEGPRVAVDEAHHNFHTLPGRYVTFGRLLERDGYRVGRSTEAFTPGSLAGIDVLVISNALAGRNAEDWTLPTPSAFTLDEIDAVEAWVEAGGALLLVADHMPFPGAAAALARRFGVEMTNGFALDTAASDPAVFFRRSGGTLAADHPVVRGGAGEAPLDSVVTFTGQAFRAVDDGVRPLLVIPDGLVNLEPDTAWAFRAHTPRRPAGGWLQGATVEHGEGRVAVLGEAAMLSAQLAGPEERPMGMNDPRAAQNPAFLLRLVRWLVAPRPAGEG